MPLSRVLKNANSGKPDYSLETLESRPSRARPRRGQGDAPKPELYERIGSRPIDAYPVAVRRSPSQVMHRCRERQCQQRMLTVDVPGARVEWARQVGGLAGFNLEHAHPTLACPFPGGGK
jgi:hypothetical protein